MPRAKVGRRPLSDMARARRRLSLQRRREAMMNEPFWRTKALAEMSEAEWESLCDGCGRCCLVKLEEDLPAAKRKAGAEPRIYFTDVGCRLLDGETCRCRDYAHRAEKVDDCVRLS